MCILLEKPHKPRVRRGTVLLIFDTEVGSHPIDLVLVRRETSVKNPKLFTDVEQKSFKFDAGARKSKRRDGEWLANR